jgi:hypothetical protein
MVTQTKYGSAAAFWWTRAYRAIVRLALRPLVRWPRHALDEDGCTLVVGCHTELLDMLPGNLGCLARQRLDNVREILLVFDTRDSEPLREMRARIARRFPELHCRIIVYSPLQRAVTRALRWAWVNCWLSWCIGIAQSTTRWVMLHDFDAMLVDPEFVEKRYQAIRERDCQYLGITHYDNPSSGILRQHGFAATIELLLDASFLRRTFRPIEIFNHVTTFEKRRVEFDTFLWAQSRRGRAAVIPVSLDDVVHPSQMICQFSYLRQDNGRVPLDRNSLMLIPYFISVGGDLRALQDVTVQMEGGAADGRVTLYERSLNLAPLTQEHLDWIIKQASHLDRALYGEVRPDVRRFLDALARFVAGARTARARGLSAG